MAYTRSEVCGRQLPPIEKLSFKFPLRCNENKLTFNLSNSDGGILDDTHWTIDTLELCRTRLNQCKAQVGKFPLHEWEKHTELTEISSHIRKVITQRFSIKPPILTRAWIKFYDILGTFPLFSSSDDSTIRALFLCEAPGAFVNAMNHFIRSNYGSCNINFDWLATTLNPYFEQIDFDAFVLDDRFIQDSFCFSNWFFASRNTGDLLHEKFAEDLKSHLCTTNNYPEDSEECPVFDVVTGDGAFNCLNDPERQEEMVFKLIFKEVMVGLRFLKQKGSMVIKFFTFFSCETISLLYLICNCFSEVTCYKPVASKHGNSEIYLVCLQFDRSIYKSLIGRFGSVEADAFRIKRELIKDDFIKLVNDLCQQISCRQESAIDSNVAKFKTLSSDQIRNITRNKYTLGNVFIQKFNLFSIPVSDQLVYGDRYRKIFSRQFYSLFDEYQHHDSKEIFCSHLGKLFDSLDMDASPQVVPTQIRASTKLRLTYGLQFDRINNSKFCCAYVLRSYIITSSHFPFTSLGSTSMDSFLDTLQSLVKRDYHIYSHERTPFSEYLDQKSASSIRYYTKGQKDCPVLNSESTAIHLLDFYESTPSITACDFDLCCSLKNVFRCLTRDKHLQTNHLLAIRFKILLSRLSVGLVYILSKAFRKTFIFPQYTPTDSISPSLFVIFSGYRKLPTQYAHVFETDDASYSADIWAKDLLELIPVPDIVADQNFFDALFNANSVAILSCIKLQLANRQDATV